MLDSLENDENDNKNVGGGKGDQPSNYWTLNEKREKKKVIIKITENNRIFFLFLIYDSISVTRVNAIA